MLGRLRDAKKDFTVIDPGGDVYIFATGDETPEDIQRAVNRFNVEQHGRRFHATEAQKAITWGGYFRRIVTDAPAHPDGPLYIYGAIPTLDDALASEVAAGVTGRELVATKGRFLDHEKNGLLYARHYSVVEPRGELGSTHCADVVPVSEAVFLAAKARDWAPPAGHASDGPCEMCATADGTPDRCLLPAGDS